MNKNARLEDVERALKERGRVYVEGFGWFYVSELPERQSRNPGTGETIVARPTKTVRFRPHGDLREAL